MFIILLFLIYSFVILIVTQIVLLCQIKFVKNFPNFLNLLRLCSTAIAEGGVYEIKI